MKKKISLTVLIIASSFCNVVFSQEGSLPDSLGLPGDNFNLGSVLDVFQKCATLEEFEKQINSAELKLNNLDLNTDGKTDYIRVTDHAKGNAHAIALQIAINEKESQDVAVIEVDKDKNGAIVVQIIGDEELYGKDYIIEPAPPSTPNPGYTGQTTSNTITSVDGKSVTVNNTTNNYNGTPTTSSPNVVVSVGFWPIMPFMYAPVYVPYASPYYYGYYPPYWNPWAPIYFHAYYGMHYHSHVYYHRTVVYRAPYAHAHYGPQRRTSVVVVNNRNNGGYNNSHSRPPSHSNGNNKPGNKPNVSKPSPKPAVNTPSRNQTPRTNPQPRPQSKPQARPQPNRSVGGGGRRR